MEVEVEFSEEFGDGEGGADAHYSGGDAGDGGAAEFAEDGLVHLLSEGAFHEEDGGRWEKTIRRVRLRQFQIGWERHLPPSVT